MKIDIILISSGLVIGKVSVERVVFCNILLISLKMSDLIKVILHLRKGFLFLIGLQVSYVTSAQSNVCESASGFLTSMPPDAPVLYKPADQATDLLVDLSLSWFSQIHTHAFSLKLSESPDLTDPFIEKTGLSDTLYTASGLEHNTTYYWQVTAGNVAGNGDPSTIREFTTIVAIPGKPMLFEPEDQAVDIPVETDLRWNSSENADSYTLQLSTAYDFSTYVIHQADLIDTVYTVSALAHDNTYYWQVKASNVAGDGLFSRIWSFSTTSATSLGKKATTGMSGFSLNVYPNPFNSTVRIDYQLPEETDVLITVYNSMGQAVQLLDAGVKSPGRYQLVWNGKKMSGEQVEGGVYFILFQTNAGILTQKMILIQ
jgi:hypothetical protein